MFKNLVWALIFLVTILVTTTRAATEVKYSIVEKARESVIALYEDPLLTTKIGTASFLTGGLIITAHHTVIDRFIAWGKLPNGNKIELTPAFVDWDRDLAVLKLLDHESETVDLTPKLELADDENLFPTQRIMAIGYPRGSPQEIVWARIVSPRRDIVLVEYNKLPGAAPYKILKNLVEFSPGIKRGFSGGPLLNQDGKVIGINTAGSDLIGYAVHVSVVKRFLAEYRRLEASVIVPAWKNQTRQERNDCQWIITSQGKWCLHR